MQHGGILQSTQYAVVSNRPVYFACKRALDLLIAAPALIVTAPVLLVAALLIKLDSRGPALFSQMRIGQGGQPFLVYKFRTMQHNADPEIHRRYVETLIQQQALGDGSYKMTRDPRITRVGRLLRRTSIDELPQIFNVLKGEMSLVGPRPPLPYEVESYQPWHLGRLATIPGITGLWQVRGRSRVPFDEMVRMDLEYIAHQSLGLDLKIMALTLPAVLSGSGAE